MLEKIRAWFERCRRILALGEYEIAFEVLPDLDAAGVSYVDPVYNNALVQILDPQAGEHADWERTTLHELIHVRMGGSLGTELGTQERAALERGVEMMTRILYRLIKGGASERYVSRVAQGCARSFKMANVARETNRGTMSNGARIGEIAMTLGGMELPEEAKALVQELIGLASGEGPIEPDMKPDNQIDQNQDPAMSPQIVARQKRIDALLAKSETLAGQSVKRALIATARETLGAACTPALEKRLLDAASPEIAEALLEGATMRGAHPSQSGAAEKQIGKAADVIPLRPGEDLSKLNPLQRQNRARIAGQLGAQATTAALTHGSRAPSRTIGRQPKKGA